MADGSSICISGGLRSSLVRPSTVDLSCLLRDLCTCGLSNLGARDAFSPSGEVFLRTIISPAGFHGFASFQAPQWHSGGSPSLSIVSGNGYEYLSFGFCLGVRVVGELVFGHCYNLRLG